MSSAKRVKRAPCFQLCVLGDEGVGKSALMRAFCTDFTEHNKKASPPPFQKQAKTVARDYAKRVTLDTNMSSNFPVHVCVTDFSGCDLYIDARCADL